MTGSGSTSSGWSTDLSGIDNTSEFVIQFKVADQGIGPHGRGGRRRREDAPNGFECDVGLRRVTPTATTTSISTICWPFWPPSVIRVTTAPRIVDDDDDVDFDDLLIVLANFGSSC